MRGFEILERRDPGGRAAAVLSHVKGREVVRGWEGGKMTFLKVRDADTTGRV